MRTKLQKFFTRLILSILGLCVIVVTLFLFLYVFWKGKKVFSLSFLLDKPAGVPLGTAGGIYPALMGSIYLGALSALIGGVLGITLAVGTPVGYSIVRYLNSVGDDTWVWKFPFIYMGAYIIISIFLPLIISAIIIRILQQKSIVEQLRETT